MNQFVGKGWQLGVPRRGHGGCACETRGKEARGVYDTRERGKRRVTRGREARGVYDARERGNPRLLRDTRGRQAKGRRGVHTWRDGGRAYTGVSGVAEQAS